MFLISRDEYFLSREEYVFLEEPTEIYMTSSQENNDKQKYIYNDRVTDGPDLVDENAPNIRKKIEEAKKALEELGFAAAGFCLKSEDELGKLNTVKKKADLVRRFWIPGLEKL